jgi:hypothetical protein
VEIKSNWLRIPSERKRRYLEPFGVSEVMLRQFVGDVANLMASDRCTYLAAAIDKPAMQKRYPAGQVWYASATAYQFLLQRYERHCAANNASATSRSTT